MKVIALGTRGIPGIQGGVETVCQELYPRMAAMGHDVTVVSRSPYVGSGAPTVYRGVALRRLYAPRRKSFEAIIHTFAAVCWARSQHPDVVHVHAVGPGLMVPMARLLGLKVVFTSHGPDYNRAKWGRAAKAVLRLGERLGARFANRIIAISPEIAADLDCKYGVGGKTRVIPNGVNRPEAPDDCSLLPEGVTPRKYVLGLARLVPEKGFHDLLEAWRTGRLWESGYKLVIAGDADHPDDYSRRLKATAAATPGIVMPGFVSGEPLRQLLGNAALFAMPSYHEGLPVALLEAMSYGLDVAVSDIPACRLPELDAANDTFAVGNVEALTELLKRKLSAGDTPRIYDLGRYNWDTIARETMAVYREAIGQEG